MASSDRPGVVCRPVRKACAKRWAADSAHLRTARVRVYRLAAQKGARERGQPAGRSRKLFQDGEVVVPCQRLEARAFHVLGISPRLPLQLGQLVRAIRDDERLRRRGPVQRTQSAGFAGVEAELVVQVAEADGLEVVDSAYREPPPPPPMLP